MTALAIEIVNLQKVYKSPFSSNTLEAVRNLNMQVPEGQVVALVGPNGAGKSTTLHCLVGLFSPTGGRIRIFGRDPREPQSREKVGFQSEQFFTYGYQTAEQILRFHAELLGIQNITESIDKVLDQLKLRGAKLQKVGTFSKGMTQRLGLAQSLLNDPDLVIWDEPSTGLDPEGRRLVIDLISEMKSRGKTILFSTHVLSDIERACDSIAVLRKGELIKQGSISELCATAGNISLEDLYLQWMKGDDLGSEA